MFAFFSHTHTYPQYIYTHKSIWNIPLLSIYSKKNVPIFFSLFTFYFDLASFSTFSAFVFIFFFTLSSFILVLKNRVYTIFWSYFSLFFFISAHIISSHQSIFHKPYQYNINKLISCKHFYGLILYIYLSIHTYTYVYKLEKKISLLGQNRNDQHDSTGNMQIIPFLILKKKKWKKRIGNLFVLYKEKFKQISPFSRFSK